MPDESFPLGSYDVLVLDYMLGRGDGLEWLKVLKQRADCPKVLLTGAGNEIIAVAMKAGADDYQRKQELTRDRLISSIRELTATEVERTVSPELAARMAGHSLGAKVHIPGIKVLHLIGEGGTARVYLASREDDDEPLVVKILRQEIVPTRRRWSASWRNTAWSSASRAGTSRASSAMAPTRTTCIWSWSSSRAAISASASPGNRCRRPRPCKLFRELMFALGDIHEKGILHRDLKPQNLMFRRDGLASSTSASRRTFRRPTAPAPARCSARRAT